MDKIKLVCRVCGHTIKVDSHEAYDYPACPICRAENSMEVDYYENKTDREIEIVRMQLDMAGNDKVWDVIEKLPEPQVRIKYRKVFFELGGKVPEKEFTI